MRSRNTSRTGRHAVGPKKAGESLDIIRLRQPSITPEELRGKLAILEAALEKNDPSVIRDALHQVVPTFHEPEDLNDSQGESVRIPAQVV